MFDAAKLGTSGLLAVAPAPSERGLYITFEGGDGGGKSTQIMLLAEYLEKASADGSSPFAGANLLVTKDPGGTELGMTLRQAILHSDHVAPKAEALLYAADRAHNIATQVRPALEAGNIVLADRYIDSSVAYQGAGRQLEANDVLQLSLWATDGLVPHLTFLLDVSAETFAARRSTDSHDRLERAGEEFHENVRTAYRALARREPQRFALIDADATAKEVHQQIVQALLDFVRANNLHIARMTEQTRP